MTNLINQKRDIHWMSGRRRIQGLSCDTKRKIHMYTCGNQLQSTTLHQRWRAFVLYMYIYCRSYMRERAREVPGISAWPDWQGKCHLQLAPSPLRNAVQKRAKPWTSRFRQYYLHVCTTMTSKDRQCRHGHTYTYTKKGKRGIKENARTHTITKNLHLSYHPLKPIW